MKYALYINGVCYDYFKTIRDIDEYLYQCGIDNSSNYYIEVKKIKIKKERKKENV